MAGELLIFFYFPALQLVQSVNDSSSNLNLNGREAVGWVMLLAEVEKLSPAQRQNLPVVISHQEAIIVLHGLQEVKLKIKRAENKKAERKTFELAMSAKQERNADETAKSENLNLC